MSCLLRELSTQFYTYVLSVELVGSNQSEPEPQMGSRTKSPGCECNEII